MALTNEDLINQGNETTQQNAIRSLQDVDGNGLGYVLNGLVPRFRVRSGLDSLATHTEENPGAILAVLDAAGTTELDILHATGAVPGAGEVAVTYDAEGVPTLVFGDGANTGYQVLKLELPKLLLTSLSAVGL